MEAAPYDEKALETRREELVARFHARMARWQPVQAAAFALSSIGLAAFLGRQLPFPPFVALVLACSTAVAVSAGVQSAYEDEFLLDMGDLRAQFESLKRARLNL